MAFCLNLIRDGSHQCELLRHPQDVHLQLDLQVIAFGKQSDKFLEKKMNKHNITRMKIGCNIINEQKIRRHENVQGLK